MKQRIVLMSQASRIIIFILFDILALLFSFMIGYISLETVSTLSFDSDDIIYYLIISIAFKIVWFYFFDLYKIVTRFIGFGDPLRTFIAVVSSNLIVAIYLYFHLPFNLLLLLTVIIIPIEYLVILTPRIVERAYEYFKATVRMKRKGENIHNTIIIGAGAAGKMALQEIKTNDKLLNRVVCFLDDNPKKQGKAILDVPILGKLDDIEKIVKEHNVQEVILAIKNIEEARQDAIIRRLSLLNVG